MNRPRIEQAFLPASLELQATPPSPIGRWLLWSLLFEVAGPHLASHSTGDPLDVLCYWIGGLLAWGAWSGLGRRTLTPQTA